MIAFQVLVVVATMMAPMAVAVDPEELFMAISEGKLETVKSLMEQGGQVTWATPEEGYSLLHLANGPQMAQILLDNGAQLEARDKGGMTPLHRAAWTANTALTAFYLEKGADIDARDNNGKTPLDLAVEKNFPGVIQVFNGEEPDY